VNYGATTPGRLNKENSSNQTQGFVEEDQKISFSYSTAASDRNKFGSNTIGTFREKMRETPSTFGFKNLVSYDV
jgi:hypothetical protein